MAKTFEMRPIEEMSIAEKGLLAIILVVSVMDLLYIMITIHWITTGITSNNVLSSQVFSNLLFALLLQGVLIITIFMWRGLEELHEIKQLLSKKKK